MNFSWLRAFVSEPTDGCLVEQWRRLWQTAAQDPAIKPARIVYATRATARERLELKAQRTRAAKLLNFQRVK